MYELRNGTARILTAMEQQKDDPVAMQYMAKALHYIPEQLGQDIQAISDWHRFNDIWSNNACLGYAASAAVGAGLDHRQTALLLETMEAAFENMTVDEARDFYEEGNF